MAATGNVKISELTQHRFNDINGQEMIPMSWSQNGDSSYESYKVTVQDLKSYFGKALNIEAGVDPSTGEPIPGPVNTYLYSYGNEISYLDRDLGQYNGGADGNFCPIHSIDLSVDKANAYIYEDGTEGTYNGWSISNAVNVKEGTLYLLKFPDGSEVPADWAVFAKRHVHTYYEITGYRDVEVVVTKEDGTTEIVIVREPIYGPAQTEVVYEPRSFHYDKFSDVQHTGYGIPKSGYLIFFAPENEEIVISAPTEALTNTKLHAVHYAIFSEIGEKFLGATTDLTQVISEAVAELEGRVESLEANQDSMGAGSVSSINSMAMPQFRGGDLVIISDHAPMSVNYRVDEYGSYVTAPAENSANHAPDYANHAGQIWVTSTNAWMALQAGSAAWKQISLS